MFYSGGRMCAEIEIRGRYTRVIKTSKVPTRICCMPRTKTNPLIGFALHYARGVYRFALAAAAVLRVGMLVNEQTTERRGKKLNSHRRHGVIIIV